MAHALSPLPKREFGYWEAAHLLNRAGFGGTPEQVLVLSDMGLEGAVDYLLSWERTPETIPPTESFTNDIMQPLSEKNRRERTQARKQGDEVTLEKFREARQERQRRDRRQMRDIQSWWLERMIETARPMQEKMTLFWHGHFATGYRAVEDSWHMLMQNDMLRRNALGNFKNDLVHGIIRDPAMIKYLNNNQNTRKSPNENLARELMELFTLGEGNGYTEDDIKQGARALTGMTFRDDTYTFNSRNHYSSSIKLLGKIGSFDGDDFVELIFRRPSVATFVPWKMHRFFVNDTHEVDRTTEAAVRRMGAVLRRSNWEVRPMLRELLMSQHFYAPEHRNTIIKSPVQLAVQAVRSLGTPIRDIRRVNQACGFMGQELFMPPSVKGWDGGRKWINTSTLFVRQNLLVYLMTGRDPESSPWEASQGGWNPSPFVEHLDGLPGRDRIADSVTYLARFILGAAPTDGRLQQWIDLARARGSNLSSETLIHLISLMTACPEYQLC